jgi:hypothetical protein
MGRRLHEFWTANPRVDLLFTDVVASGGMTGAQVAAQARAIRPLRESPFHYRICPQLNHPSRPSRSGRAVDRQALQLQ